MKQRDQVSPNNALREFARGYLNEDLGVEYGSPVAATKRFCRDADRAQVQQVAREWQEFLAGHATSSIEETNRSLHSKYGAVWQFRSREELDEVSRILAEHIRLPNVT